MGVVYRATRERDGLPVAVKTILPAVGTSRKQIERFLRECEILAQLEHPHIVAFQEFGEAGDLIFLVMDWVDGPDLGAAEGDGTGGRPHRRAAWSVKCSPAWRTPTPRGSSTGTSSRRTS